MKLLDEVIMSGESFDRGYPMNEWNTQMAWYREYEYHFSGRWLKEKVSENSENLKYPLGYNVFKIPVVLHTSFLFGEVPDGSSSVVSPAVELWRDGKKLETAQSKVVTKNMEIFINSILDENSGRSKLQRAALDCQIFGGTILGVLFSPERALDGMIPLRIKVVRPFNYYPVWSHDDFDDVIETIISYQISSRQAEELGVKVDSSLALYLERWTKREYEISVDGEIVSVYGIPAEGEPIGGVIPYVYIPHPPRYSFYGESLLKDKFGLAKEVNARLVDVGDVIMEDATNIPAVANARQPAVRRISGVKTVLDLGYSQGDRTPEINFPPSRGTSAQSAGDFVMELNDLARSEAYCPPVLFGKDEGSQRSAATLALRAIPLVAHIREERTYFTDGLAKLLKRAMIVAASKNLTPFSPEQARQARIRIGWYPMMPRDVMEEVASIVSRVQSHIMSPMTAIEKIGDIIDVDGEWNKILEWIDVESSSNMPSPTARPGGQGEMAGLISNRKGDIKDA